MIRVLIAEDDPLTAALAETVLVTHGYDVCGTACTVGEAVELVHRYKPDLALLDMNLADGELGSEIMTQLGKTEGLGVLYATGATFCSLSNAAHGHGCLTKPYTPRDLLRSLEIVAEIVAAGKASQPFPRGFTVLPSANITPSADMAAAANPSGC